MDDAPLGERLDLGGAGLKSPSGRLCLNRLRRWRADRVNRSGGGVAAARTVSFRLPDSARPKLARTRRALPARGNEELRRRRHWPGNVG